MAVYRNSRKKVKRPHVDWHEVLLETGNFEAFGFYYRLLTKHKNISLNRAAYNALKRCYSTTALNRYRWLGDSLV